MCFCVKGYMFSMWYSVDEFLCNHVYVGCDGHSCYTACVSVVCIWQCGACDCYIECTCVVYMDGFGCVWYM